MGFIFGVVDRKQKWWPFEEEIYINQKDAYLHLQG